MLPLILGVVSWDLWLVCIAYITMQHAEGLKPASPRRCFLRPLAVAVVDFRNGRRILVIVQA